MTSKLAILALLAIVHRSIGQSNYNKWYYDPWSGETVTVTFGKGNKFYVECCNFASRWSDGGGQIEILVKQKMVSGKEWCGYITVWPDYNHGSYYYGRRNDGSGIWTGGDTFKKVDSCPWLPVKVTGVTGYDFNTSGSYFTCDPDDFEKKMGPVGDGTVFLVHHKPIGKDRDEWCGPVIVWRNGDNAGDGNNEFYGRRNDGTGNQGQWKEGDTIQRVDKCEL